MLGRHILGVCFLFTPLSQELPLELQLCNKETSIQTILLRYFEVYPSQLPFGWCIKDVVDLSVFITCKLTKYEIVITNY